MNAILAPDLQMPPMVERDLDSVLAIENDIYSFPWTRGNFRDALKAGYSGWTCLRRGELVGYAMIMLAVDEAHLLNISIAAGWQRRGFGARLLRHVFEVSADNGAHSLLLEVRPSNGRAIELYRNFGFEQIGVRRAYYPAAVGREDAIIFRRALEQPCP